ncbi:Ankyrin repeats (3 copies) [Rubripirellula obstinata]|uniref:Ankyrin repeats (3 copies) n=2 Tax=Rubripirellula obstinata TaxID=406547 RepID=A0A5B1CC44_9BACT|nr:ankyrin repeat domain-containing protein [Rubripirellula obstinata]KAA1258748.1 Ankyrin repeats (3 copies) [Rubripirellula obstinata]
MLSVSRPNFLIPFALVCSASLIAGCGSSPTDADQGKADLTTQTSESSPPIAADSGSEDSETKELPTYSDDAFRYAAHDGNLDLVRSAIQSGTDVNVADPTAGYTALLMAAYNGHANVVKFLLENDADVDARDREGKTPLMHACTNSSVETVRLLIDGGADINVTESTEGFTPLMTAAALGQTEIVKLLLERSADKGVVDQDGDTAISHAQNSQHDEIVELLK